LHACDGSSIPANIWQIEVTSYPEYRRAIRLVDMTYSFLSNIVGFAGLVFNNEWKWQDLKLSKAAY